MLLARGKFSQRRCREYFRSCCCIWEKFNCTVSSYVFPAAAAGEEEPCGATRGSDFTPVITECHLYHCKHSAFRCKGGRSETPLWPSISLVTSYPPAKLSPSIWGGRPRERWPKGQCRVLRRRVLPYPVLPLALPEAFTLWHSENKLLASIRSFPSGIAAPAGSGCGDAKRKLRSLAFLLLANLPSPEAASDQPPGIPGTSGGPDPAAGANCPDARLGELCECASPPSVRGRRRIPFPARKSLYAPVAAACVTPAPPIINGGGKGVAFCPPAFFFQCWSI